MTIITYVVRHSKGNSWAVDEKEWWQSRGRGVLSTKNKTWYFPTKEEADAFGRKKTSALNERN